MVNMQMRLVNQATVESTGTQRSVRYVMRREALEAVWPLGFDEGDISSFQRARLGNTESCHGFHPQLSDSQKNPSPLQHEIGVS